jgi:hypothetical protein
VALATPIFSLGVAESPLDRRLGWLTAKMGVATPHLAQRSVVFFFFSFFSILFFRKKI